MIAARKGTEPGLQTHSGAYFHALHSALGAWWERDGGPTWTA